MVFNASVFFRQDYCTEAANCASVALNLEPTLSVKEAMEAVEKFLGTKVHRFAVDGCKVNEESSLGTVLKWANTTPIHVVATAKGGCGKFNSYLERFTCVWRNASDGASITVSVSFCPWLTDLSRLPCIASGPLSLVIQIKVEIRMSGEPKTKNNFSYVSCVRMFLP